MEITAPAADSAVVIRRKGGLFLQLLLQTNVGNNTPDLIPIGGRDRHASRFSMSRSSPAHAPLTRDALRAERIALRNSNSASTAERLRQRQEEARRRRNATQTTSIYLWRQQRCVGRDCLDLSSPSK